MLAPERAALRRPLERARRPRRAGAACGSSARGRASGGRARRRAARVVCGSSSASSTVLIARRGHARRDERARATRRPVAPRKASSRIGSSSSRCSLRAAMVGEALVLVQLGPADHVAEPLPERLLRGADDDPAVGRPGSSGTGRSTGGRSSAPRRDVAVRRRPGADVHQLVQRRLEERDVAVAADAVAAGAPDARQEGDRRRVAAGEVDEREARSSSAARPARPVRLCQPASPCIM